VNPQDIATVLDWKRRVFALYERIRFTEDPLQAWDDWRRTRDALFKTHPQSPIPEAHRAVYAGIPVFDYAANLRVVGNMRRAEESEIQIPDSGGTTVVFTRFAVVDFTVDGEDRSLDVFWLNGYGGGVFLPFRDATAGKSTYGAGRYLFDTVKGADLGGTGGQLILDFNFAYNPSCSYDPKWVCPLAPPGNRLDVPIEAGERAKAEGPPFGSPS
jgi:uncharacterized protein (DUF1684 family)